MPKQWSEKQKRLMGRFRKERGFWSARLWERILELDPDFFEQYLNFSSYPAKKGTLPRKFRELVYIAINASTTHLYEPALRQHIKNALALGATREEVMEVLEIVSVLGIHSCVFGVPILVEEWESRRKK